MEVMTLDEMPWDDTHHRSTFLPSFYKIENNLSSMFSSETLNDPQSPISILSFDFEQNLGNISTTIPVDISMKPGITENIHIGASCSLEEIQTYKTLFQEFHDIFSWSYEEMPGIDPIIDVHEIKTYPDAKPVRQLLHLIHPRKVVTIKTEAKKLLKAGFIYFVPLTDWVSNIVPVNKK